MAFLVPVADWQGWQDYQDRTYLVEIPGLRVYQLRKNLEGVGQNPEAQKGLQMNPMVLALVRVHLAKECLEILILEFENSAGKAKQEFLPPVE